MFRPCFLAFALLVLLSATALGLGADHKKGELPPHDGWLKGTYEAVNLPCRVHGYWINSSDSLFYQGDNAVLEQMLERFATIPDLNVRVILHAGKGVARSPWSKEEHGAADWQVTLYAEGGFGKRQDHVQVDVWLSGSIKLDDLKVPASMSVESGKEIDNYIENRTLEIKR